MRWLLNTDKPIIKKLSMTYIRREIVRNWVQIPYVLTVFCCCFNFKFTLQLSWERNWCRVELSWFSCLKIKMHFLCTKKKCISLCRIACDEWIELKEERERQRVREGERQRETERERAGKTTPMWFKQTNKTQHNYINQTIADSIVQTTAQTDEKWFVFDYYRISFVVSRVCRVLCMLVAYAFWYHPYIQPCRCAAIRCIYQAGRPNKHSDRQSDTESSNREMMSMAIFNRQKDMSVFLVVVGWLCMLHVFALL